MRARDKDRVGARGLRSSSRLRRRDANHLGRNGGGRGFEFGADDSLDVVDADKDVFGFQVGVDDSALAVDIVEAEEDLLGDLLADVIGHAAVVIPLDQSEQVFSEHLKHHADVGPVRPPVRKVVEERDDVPSARMARVRLDHSLKQFDLVEGGFGVVRRRLDDLERDVLVDPALVSRT